VGDEFGVTRERIRQLIRIHGWEKKPHATKGRVMCPTCGFRTNGESMAEHRRTNLAHQRAKMERHRKWTDNRREWDTGAFIYALHKAGYKPIEIADLIGKAITYPYRWLNWLGENPYIRGPIIGRLNPQQAAERDRRIAVSWAEGMEARDIMEAYNVNLANLHRIVAEQGARRPDWFAKEFTGWNAMRRRQKEREELSDNG